MKAHTFKRDREYGIMLMKMEKELMDRFDVKLAFKCMILMVIFNFSSCTVFLSLLVVEFSNFI